MPETPPGADLRRGGRVLLQTLRPQRGETQQPEGTEKTWEKTRRKLRNCFVFTACENEMKLEEKATDLKV